MTRRGGTTVQAIGLVAVIGLFVYGFYSYGELQTKLRRAEEKGERLRQQHDSLSAQLQGLSLANLFL